MKMRRMLGRFLLLLLVFVCSVAVTTLLLNGQTTDDRQDMNDCTLAEVMLEFDGNLANRMCGYAQPMQADFVRDCVTPLDTSRELTFVINPYGLSVTSLSYEIRTSDGTKVIENRKMKDLSAQDSYLRVKVALGCTLRLNQEYSMQVTLQTENGEAYYYTRVVSRPNLNTAGYVSFANTFAEKCLDKQNANELVDYMEPDNTQVGTNYASIDIHSTLAQISWGALKAQMYRKGVPTIKEINETTASISLEYQITARNEEGEMEIYDVTDFFRMRYTTARVLLLDFERETRQVFSPGESSITPEGLILGVRDRNVEQMTNQEAGLTAFVQEGDLWSFSPEDGKVTRIFSFRKKEGGDLRDARLSHGIQIIRVYDNKDVDFVLYGYMNRGMREGWCGLGVFHYDNDQNLVEEKVFIPSTESYEFLEKDLGKLSYVSQDGSLFLLFAGKLYQVNLEEGSFTVLEEGIWSSEFSVSQTHAHVAFRVQEGKDAGKICMMDLDTLKRRLISPKDNRQLRLIGFMNEDLVYGILRDKDILTDADGHVREGLRQLRFENFEGETLKKYTPGKGLYITGISLGQRLLEFDLSVKSGSGYRVSSRENILNNATLASEYASVELTSTTRTGTRVRLSTPTKPKTEQVLLLEARIRTPNDREILLDSQTVEKGAYYVYAQGRLDRVLADPAAAILLADEKTGVVLDSAQKYVWERGNKKTQAMLNLEDIPLPIRQGSMDIMTLSEALSQEGEILDLSGCSLDSVLYEVSAQRPVMARTSENASVVIVGYDAYNTWLLDPGSGEVYPFGMQDSTALFEDAGNVFLTYMEYIRYY